MQLGGRQKTMTNVDNLPGQFYKNMIGMVIASMMAMLGIVVDGVVISRFLGTQKMAAYGLVTPITNLIMVFSGILASGSQVVCGHFLGAGDHKGAKRAFSMCMTVRVLLSIVLMGSTLLFRDSFCRMLGAVGKSADLLPLASDYLLLHGLALLVVAQLYRVQPHRCFSLAGWTLLTGSLLFSGSMIIKCWASIGAVGILTPVGGTLLLLGWFVLLCGIVLFRS